MMPTQVLPAPQGSTMTPERDVPFYAAIITLAFGHLHSHSVVYRDVDDTSPSSKMLTVDSFIAGIEKEHH